ncbi:hypothetical protein AVEN_35095-1 [Araneus ventricosus]|uniref:Uncharacterized protein n=1 Tax=Araneus ventricosus TaxID=182803 RepID=A0A4Y2I5F0_ARAVE|nr:hypothetical protein AVEN_35095-1 [Araneus ventricosus]
MGRTPNHTQQPNAHRPGEHATNPTHPVGRKMKVGRKGALVWCRSLERGCQLHLTKHHSEPPIPMTTRATSSDLTGHEVDKAELAHTF